MNNQDTFTRVVATLGLGAALIALTLSLVTYSSPPSEAPPSITFPAAPETQEDVEARAFQTLVYLTNGGDKQVVASGGELEIQSGGILDVQSGATVGLASLDLAGGTLTWDDDDDTTSVASFDDVITTTLGAATGRFDILTGNFKLGNGTPTLTQNGEDAYVEGTFEVDGQSQLDGGLDLNASTLTFDADADTTAVASFDDVITYTLGAATGRFDILTGNLKLGNGTPTLTQNGEDAYVEGTFEVDGQSQFDGGLDLNASTLTFDADADTTAVASFDDVITYTLGAATGRVDVLTGNLAIGDGTPDTTLDGENAYIEGSLEVDGATNFDGAADFALTVAVGNSLNATADVDVGTFVNLSAQSSLTIGAGEIITPTGTYQLIDSGGVITTDTTTPIATAGREAGDLLIIRNANAADAITIDGTGGTVECKADIVLGASDTVTLIYNGSAWNCIANYDNS